MFIQNILVVLTWSIEVCADLLLVLLIENKFTYINNSFRTSYIFMLFFLKPPRYHSGWMTWLQDPPTSTGSLALAWIGFADLHSGISHYFVSVGRTYGGSELTPVSINSINFVYLLRWYPSLSDALIGAPTFSIYLQGMLIYVWTKGHTHFT